MKLIRLTLRLFESITSNIFRQPEVLMLNSAFIFQILIF